MASSVHGTKGKFQIELDGTGSQVSLAYSINMDVDNGNNEKLPKNLIFYYDDQYKEAIYHDGNNIVLEGFIGYSDTNKVQYKDIYWSWDLETGKTQEEIDENDEADSKWMGEPISLAINVVGKQVDENPLSGQYSVTFDANGGTLKEYGNSSKASKQVAYGEAYGKLPEPTREGYTFLGWNGKNMLNLKPYIMNNGIVNISKDMIVIKKVDYVNTTEKKATTLSDFGFVDGNVYTISAKVTGDFSGRIYAFWGTSLYSDNVSEGVFSKNIRVTTIQQDKWRFLVNQNQSYSAVNNVNAVLKSDELIISDIQIEEGSTATAYEPYYIQSSTPVTQNKNHVLKAIWEKQ